MFLLKTKTILTVLLIACCSSLFAQVDMLSDVEKTTPKPHEFVTNAFKSSRVVNGHSMEFIGKGVLDVRILHRFGLLNSGFNNLYGLDQASMRFGFDYGISKNLTVGVGRSTFDKEWDGFIKYRPLQQSRGGKRHSPISIVLISGMTVYTKPFDIPNTKYYFSHRMAFYNEIIIGRKFSENFSLQLAPTHVHLNLVEKNNYSNDIFAVGVGARYKFTKRTAFVVDYHCLINPLLLDEESSSNSQFTFLKNPLSIGFDIETGGHVFQLHFSNSSGMNEKAFITNTSNSWGRREVSFGFNLSRVFTVAKK
jgi:hypothetical protein